MANYNRNRGYPPVLIPLLTFTLIILSCSCLVVGVLNLAYEPPPSPGGGTTDAPSDDASSEILDSGTKDDTVEPAYKEITLLSAGDIMFHNNNVLAGKKADGSYDYTDVFGYLAPIVSRYDYAVANFETTLSGDVRPYTQAGSVLFNVPDAAADALKGCGFDMMLFANNHTNDGNTPGLTRTLETLSGKGFDTLGAKASEAGQANKIIDIGGIKIGMLNYTNDGSFTDGASGTLNGRPLGDSAGLINLFYLDHLDAFYTEAEREMQSLRAAGAQIILFYIHFGREYYIQPDANQKAIVQKLCDLGADAIIGSHPHVIQPMEVLTSSTDPSHKTICFYSLGNLISNQHRDSLSADYCKGNNKETENGLMVVLTLRQYKDGTVVISAVEAIPTWVHHYERTEGEGEYNYRIIPLEEALKDPGAFGLNDSNYGQKHATEALKTTNDLIASSVATWNATYGVKEVT